MTGWDLLVTAGALPKVMWSLEFVHFSLRCWGQRGFGHYHLFPFILSSASCTLLTLSPQGPPGGDLGQIQPPCLCSL